ncbi:Rhob [Nucleospora cyclopteri]
MVEINEEIIKIVFVGESNSGKSSIIKKYLQLETIKKPTIFDNYRVKYVSQKKRTDQIKSYNDINEKPASNFNSHLKQRVNLANTENTFFNICDTSGKEEMERLMRMSYLNADVFVLCIECHNLKDNVYYKKLIQSLQKTNKPIVLAATKCDKIIGTKKKSSAIADEKKYDGEFNVVTANMITGNLDVINSNAQEIVANYSLNSYVLISIKRKKSVNDLFDECARIYYESKNEEKIVENCCNCFSY